MTVHVNIAKAKATLSDLVARAEAGEEVVLTRHGKPVVTLVSHDQRRRRRAGAWAHLGRLDDPYLFLRPDRELEEMMDAPILPPE